MRFVHSICAVLLASSAFVANAGNCVATVDDCDAHFTSMVTQTWVEQTIAPHTLQVMTYFGNYHACLEDTASGLALSDSACSRPSSRFSVADNSSASVIKNQETSKCLAAKFSTPAAADTPCSACVSTCVGAQKSLCGNSSGNSSECESLCKDTLKCKPDTPAAPKTFKLKYTDCCRPHGCTPDQVLAQMWLQPVTTTNPYNVIQNDYNGGKYCLSRVNGTTDVVLALCDDLWASRYTQTFAHISAGYPYVQLSAFWANSKACVGAGSDGSVELSEDACKGQESIFAFSDLKDFGYFKNLVNGQCLTADFGLPPAVDCAQCAKICSGACAKGADKCPTFCDGLSCTQQKPVASLVSAECDEQSDVQLWTPLGTDGKDAYKRIQVKHTDLKEVSWCITRTGDTDNGPCTE